MPATRFPTATPSQTPSRNPSLSSIPLLPTFSPSTAPSSRRTSTPSSFVPSNAPSFTAAPQSMSTLSPSPEAGATTTAPSADNGTTLAPTPVVATPAPSVRLSRPVIEALIGPSVVTTPLSLVSGRTLAFQSFRLIAERAVSNSSFLVRDGQDLNIANAFLPLVETRFLLAQMASPFAFAPLVSNGSMPIVAAAEWPAGISLTRNATLEGVPQSLQDLTASALTCISFPSVVGPPSDFAAAVVPPNSTLYVWAYGASGFVDESTGEMRGFRAQQAVRFNQSRVSYPTGLPQPVFCAAYWFGTNVYAGTNYSANILAIAFNAVRSGGDQTMVYSDNPAFYDYEVALFLYAVPFFALMLLCLIIYPSFVLCRSRIGKCYNIVCSRCCGRLCPRGDFCWTFSCLKCCCRTRCSCCAPDRPADKRRPLLKSTSQFGSRSLVLEDDRVNLIDEVAGHDTGSRDAELIAIDEMLGSEVKELKDGSVPRYQEKINRILTSPHISNRMCFVFALFFTIACGLVIILGLILSADAGAILNEKFLDAAQQMGSAYNQTTIALDQVQRALNSSVVQPPERDLLLMEQDRLVRALSLMQPKNLRIANDWKTTLQLGPESTSAVQIVTAAVEWTSPLLIALSLVLASCTCRWNDTVLFENLSICLGFTLRNWLIACATLAWFTVAFLFWDLAAYSDICVMPSILLVPTLNDSGLMTQPVAYDPSSNNYFFPYGQQGDVLALFLSECAYSSSPFANLSVSGAGFNPLTVLLVQAAELNQRAVVQMNATTGGKSNEIISGLTRIPGELSIAVKASGCSTLGQDLQSGLYNMCQRVLVGDFLVFFFLSALAVQFMVIIPCTHWVAPNLYRQWRANRVYERASRKMETLLKNKTTLHMNESRPLGFNATSTQMQCSTSRTPGLEESSKPRDIFMGEESEDVASPVNLLGPHQSFPTLHDTPGQIATSTTASYDDALDIV